MSSTRCYIEEYENERGQVSARLREKVTGRKVDLGLASAAAKSDFLQFLSAAVPHRAEMPDVFTKDGDADFVVVSGDVDFDAPDEIRFHFNDRLSYTYA
ncbi:hypothetical protein [Rathayibacter festucae]|uniref:Uncharacterized protein n=1 Tax=Rathayibacter festucae DSM 15932 TaxID=1328866 RepID=A0A3Q9UY39_9MICO|nr:hypothetical protein [Rathayibacter festucae]AZZ51907.1 hypothetical protein C1I64_07480 [Rathayibacter festucae DSM 15932]